MNKLFLAAAGALMLSAAAQPAAAADMPVKAPIYKAPAAEIWSWDGYYVGINGGYSWGRWDSSCPVGTDCFVGMPGAFTTPAAYLAAFTNTASPHVDGAVAGVQYGRNWQFGRWVLGLESDWDWTGERDKRSGTASVSLLLGDTRTTLTSTIANQWKFSWFSTSRARVGWAADRWLVYVTGGLAAGRASYSETTTATATVGAVTATAITGFSESRTRYGGTAGVGAEWLLAKNWTLGAEYLYIDLGHTHFLRGTADETDIKLRDHIVRVKLNYLFDFGGPVVARY